jgi:hypothetical protein
MRKLVILVLAASLFTGCATPKKGESGGLMQRYSESKRLAQAVEMLAKGDSPGAAKVLNAICTGSAVPGVTDEALFRLALLSLKPSTERPASVQGYQLLKRLKKEYPTSPWTVQAAPLVELISVAEEFRHQNRNLKAANQSLTKETNELNKKINELNKNLEQLKHLDQELEQKTR